MAKAKYDILRETFCIYCQRQFASPANLQRHVLNKHPNTYASSSILKARRDG